MSEDQPLRAIPPTRKILPGAYGIAGDAGVTAHQREDLAIAMIVARKGAGPALAAAVQSTLGIELPFGSCAVSKGGITLVGIGPARWLAVSDFSADLVRHLGAHAAVTEQDDSSVVFDLAGPKVRLALAKGLAVDLDPVVFKPGDAATTSIALIGATFWQVDEAPSYRFLIARSYAVAFTRFLVTSAAEYGFQLSDA